MKKIFLLAAIGWSIIVIGQCPAPTNLQALNSSGPVVWSSPVDTFIIEYGPASTMQATGTFTVTDTFYNHFGFASCDTVFIYVKAKCGSAKSSQSGPVMLYSNVVYPNFTHHYLSKRFCGDSIFSTTGKMFQYGNDSLNPPDINSPPAALVERFSPFNSAPKYMYADGSGMPDSMLSFTSNWFHTAFLSSYNPEVMMFYYFSNNTVNPGDNVSLKVHLDNGLQFFPNVFSYSGDDSAWRRKVIDLSSYISTQTNRIRVTFEIDQTTALQPEYNDFLLDEIYVGPRKSCPYYTPVSQFFTKTGNNLLIKRSSRRNRTDIQWGPIGFTPNNGQHGDTTIYQSDSVFLQNIPATTQWIYIKDTCKPTYVHNIAQWTGPFDIDSSQVDYLYGEVFMDANGNCIKDSGEYAGAPTGDYLFNLTTNRTIFINDNGKFYSPAAQGVNVLKYNSGSSVYHLNTFPSSCSSNIINFYTDSLSGVIQDFAREPSASADVALSFTCFSGLQGDTVATEFCILNRGSQHLDSVRFSVLIDTVNHKVVGNNGFVQSLVDTRVYTRYIKNILPSKYHWFKGPFLSSKIGTQHLGISSGQLFIDTLFNDVNPGNNSRPFTQYNWAAIDPNDKIVIPTGETKDTAVNELYYRIRFQNNGNYPAQVVRVVDSFPSFLIGATFREVSSSHEYYLTIDSNSVATFLFEDIMLPDSASDPDGSQGYVDFLFESNSNMQVGDSVANRAYIYFDYQPPIITNWAWTKIVQPDHTSLFEFKTLSFNLFPNPAQNSVRIETVESGDYHVLITDLTGKVLSEFSFSGNRFEVNTEKLNTGIYLIQLKNDDQKAFGTEKLTIIK